MLLQLPDVAGGGHEILHLGLGRPSTRGDTRLVCLVWLAHPERFDAWVAESLAVTVGLVVSVDSLAATVGPSHCCPGLGCDSWVRDMSPPPPLLFFRLGRGGGGG